MGNLTLTLNQDDLSNLIRQHIRDNHDAEIEANSIVYEVQPRYVGPKEELQVGHTITVKATLEK